MIFAVFDPSPVTTSQVCINCIQFFAYITYITEYRLPTRTALVPCSHVLLQSYKLERSCLSWGLVYVLSRLKGLRSAEWLWRRPHCMICDFTTYGRHRLAHALCASRVIDADKAICKRSHMLLTMPLTDHWSLISKSLRCSKQVSELLYCPYKDSSLSGGGFWVEFHRAQFWGLCCFWFLLMI